jgi:branched-chain amino acid transport system substrate-binding protein
VVGSVGTYSGIAGASISAGLVALQAWAQLVNAQGGIKGHAVRVVTGDDGADPARHQQLVQQFVEQRGVQVFVYNADAVTGQASIRYLEQKRIPVIGSEGAGQWYYESPMHFPQTTMAIPLMRSWLRGAAELMLPAGKKKFGFVACQEIQFCADSARLWPGLAKEVGFDLVYQSRVAFAQPNFTSECLGARNAGVEFFYIASDANSFSRVARDCKSVGYTPTYGLVSATIQDRQKDDSNLDGAIVPGPNVPWFFTANPEIRLFNDTLARFAPGHVADGNSQLGWTAARVFEAAARSSPDPTTSAGMLEGLWSLKGETVGGTTYPKSFPRDQKAPEVSCWAQVVIKGGKFVSPDNGKFTCS